MISVQLQKVSEGITEFNSYSLAEILLEGREYVGEAFEPVYLKDAAAIFELCRG